MERMRFEYKRPEAGDMIFASLWNDIECDYVDQLCQVKQWLNDWQMLVWECQRQKYNVFNRNLEDTVLTLVPYNGEDELVEDLPVNSPVEE